MVILVDRKHTHIRIIDNNDFVVNESYCTEEILHNGKPVRYNLMSSYCIQYVSILAIGIILVLIIRTNYFEIWLDIQGRNMNHIYIYIYIYIYIVSVEIGIHNL